MRIPPAACLAALPFLYIHRTGSNVENGRYYADDDWHNTIAHDSSFRTIDVAALRAGYAAAKALSPEVATQDSPLRHPKAGNPFPRIFTHFDAMPVWGDSEDVVNARGGPAERAARVVASLDGEGRWITNLRSTSHPYTPAQPPAQPTVDASRTLVGDQTDTSPYRAEPPIPGISTGAFVRNMDTLITYLGTQP